MAPLLYLLLFFAKQVVVQATPTATPWPQQFHSLLYVNSSSGTLEAIDLWYDWPKGRNFNIIQHQLKNVLHDLEWTNGTSFFYDLDAQTCTSAHVDVGILRPDWMDNATYLGQQEVDGFTCNVWSNADFIVYYEDVETNRPVHWVFYTGMSIHVMTFEVGAALEDGQWQAPVYCFDGENSGHAAAKRLTTTGVEKDPLRRWLNSLEAALGTSSSVI